MTTETANTTAPASPDAGPDPRNLLARATAIAGKAIGAVGPEALDLPTPCPDFDVRGMADHLIGVMGQVAVIGRGGDIFAGGQSEPTGDLTERWTAAVADAEAAWSDDTALTRTVRLPWDEGPGGRVLVGYLAEITVHTWDLATATGQQLAWDDDVALAALSAYQRVLPAQTGRAAVFEAIRQQMPEEMRNFGDPFADAVPVAGDASPIDRLMAWSGRTP